MKILYTGIEDDGLTYGGEYKVLHIIPRPNGTCYVVVDDNGAEVFLGHYNAQLIENQAPRLVPMPGTEGDWGERHWGKE